MKRMMSKLMGKGIIAKMELEERVKKAINNEKGMFDPVYAIIFAAILVIALLASETSVSDIFTDFVDDFKTWLDTKKTALFS